MKGWEKLWNRLRSCLPRLSRRQRVFRNLLCVAICLPLLAWAMEFPALGRRSLLRRLEHQFLLEGSELLFTSTQADYGFDAPHTLYARNGDLLLTVNYNWTILGLSPWRKGEIWQETDGICLQHQRYDIGTYMAFGNLEEAASAELTVTLTQMMTEDDAFAIEGVRPGMEYREVYTAKGERQNPYCFTFQLDYHYIHDQILDGTWKSFVEMYGFAPMGGLSPEDAVLRLYDEAGELLHEKRVDVPEESLSLYW